MDDGNMEWPPPLSIDLILFPPPQPSVDHKKRTRHFYSSLWQKIALFISLLFFNKIKYKYSNTQMEKKGGKGMRVPPPGRSALTQYKTHDTMRGKSIELNVVIYLVVVVVDVAAEQWCNYPWRYPIFCRQSERRVRHCCLFSWYSHHRRRRCYCCCRCSKMRFDLSVFRVASLAAPATGSSVRKSWAFFFFKIRVSLSSL